MVDCSVLNEANVQEHETASDEEEGIEVFKKQITNKQNIK